MWRVIHTCIRAQSKETVQQAHCVHYIVMQCLRTMKVLSPDVKSERTDGHAFRIHSALLECSALVPEQPEHGNSMPRGYMSLSFDVSPRC
jgi:hypothetical protein